MNVLVCISRIPDTEARLGIGDDGISIDPNGSKYIISPYDELAIEEGLRIREKIGGTVTALCIGPDVSKDVLRSALAMSADSAVLIKTEKVSDYKFVAENIINHYKANQYDLLLFGKSSGDYESQTIPAYIAAKLNIPFVSSITSLNIEANSAEVVREADGAKETYQLSLPAVLSAQKGLNNPRFPKLPDIMKAKSKPIVELEALAVEYALETIRLETVSKKRNIKVVGDSDSEIAEIVSLLRDEAKVI
jgi:electron transfer flavoprotein beta subunit